MIDPMHAMLYALSDPHGWLDVLEKALSAIDLSGDAHLYLLGDYIPHDSSKFSADDYLRRSTEALIFVRDFEATHRGKVTVLAGNHELMLLDSEARGEITIAANLRRWLRSLASYAETERQVFVHAGVDEEAGEWWRWASEPWYFCSKYPPSVGSFELDVIAGHVNVRQAAHEMGVELDEEYRGVFWDGESHFYIDGTTERSGCIPILCYDSTRATYQQMLATSEGVSEPMPVRARGAHHL